MATAVAVPLFGPVVFADSGSDEPSTTASRMVRPSELPIYEEPEEVLEFEYHGRERTSLEEGVGVVRKEIEGAIEATRSTREKVVHFCETGKAHTMATVDYVTDEDNTLSRAGAITIGGLAGLVLGARRKGGIIKKVFYTSTGVAGTASLCYPRQAYQVSQDLYGNAKDYANIGYNFVVGVKPQSKVAAPDEPPVTSSPEAEVSPSTESTPSSEEDTTTPESEGDESSTSVKQEGKDVIIQVDSTLPEKDYGQSNPEDSDMYTTRS